MNESFLAEGFLLAKKIGLGQPKRIENAKILVANTAMDTDKIKVFVLLVPNLQPLGVALPHFWEPLKWLISHDLLISLSCCHTLKSTKVKL